MKIHSTGNIDFKPWWTGLHLSCPDCGSIYELEEGDINSLYFSDMGKDYECLTFECNRCGHNIYANRYFIDLLKKSLLKDCSSFESRVYSLPLDKLEYIQEYLNPAGFKREEADIDGCFYDISKLGNGSKCFKDREEL